jgi:3-hydroxyacyl-CoA dehydrogenase/enoyl-CoA hydratase/3-hydroxybutyryl-CoA epimerase
MLGIVPGWGGIKRLPRLVGAPAALDLLLTARPSSARRAKRMGMADECVPVRIMENTARGVLRALPAPRALRFPLSLTLLPARARVHREAAAERRSRNARVATLSGAVRHPRAVHALRRQRARRAGPTIPRRSRRCSAAPTAANLIRVFRLQERLKALGKDDAFKGNARARRRRRQRWAATSRRGARCAG